MRVKHPTGATRIAYHYNRRWPLCPDVRAELGIIRCWVLQSDDWLPW